MNTDGSNQVRITNRSTIDGGPKWSPSREYLAFTSTWRETKDISDVFIMNTDGANIKRLTYDGKIFKSFSWSPNGTSLEIHAITLPNIYIINVDGSGLRQLTNYPEAGNTLDGFNREPEWSPDGKRLLFGSYAR